MKTNNFEQQLLEHYFENTTVPNVGDATGLRGSTGPGNLYLSLHTAYPGEAGVQNTNECAYTSYVRKIVARSASEWDFTGGAEKNLNQLEFAEATGGSETAFFVGVGRQSAGATELDYIVPMGTELGECLGLTTDNIQIPGLSGLAVDDRIAFFAEPKGPLPTGLTAGTVYWVISVASDVIQVSTSQGGGAVNITAAGVAIAWKMVGLPIAATIKPTINAQALAVREE